MTLSKRNKGLVALLAFQLVLVFVTATRGSDAVSYKQEPVLAGFDANAVTPDAPSTSSSVPRRTAVLRSPAFAPM